MMKKNLLQPNNKRKIRISGLNDRLFMDSDTASFLKAIYFFICILSMCHKDAAFPNCFSGTE